LIIDILNVLIYSKTFYYFLEPQIVNETAFIVS